jgi:hypothetical protein
VGGFIYLRLKTAKFGLPDCQFDCVNASIALSFPPNIQIGNPDGSGLEIGSDPMFNLKASI